MPYVIGSNPPRRMRVRVGARAIHTQPDTDYSWVAHNVIIFSLKSRTKDLPKLLSSTGIREGKFVSVNNFSTQEELGHILIFRVMAVRDIKL